MPAIGNCTGDGDERKRNIENQEDPSVPQETLTAEGAEMPSTFFLSTFTEILWG